MNTSTDTTEQATTPVIIIINPASGSVKSAGDGEESFQGQIEAELKKRDIEFEIRPTTIEIGADKLAKEIAAKGASHIIVCGGDGTVMSAINGLYAGQKSTDAPDPVLSIVPGGTANLLATALGIPTDIEAAIEIAFNGSDAKIDLGRCDDVVFALGLGLGLTERLVSKASAQEKETLGKLAYVKAMMREIGAPPTRFRYALDDGKEITSRGVAIVIANAGDVGGRLQFAPDAKMDDGKLDLCILHRFQIHDLGRMVWNMMLKRLPEDRAVTFAQAKKIEIFSEPPLDLQIDGEEVDQTTPLTAQVLAGAMSVRIPTAHKDEEKDEIIPAAQVSKPRAKIFAALGVIGAAVAVFALWKRRK